MSEIRDIVGVHFNFEDEGNVKDKVAKLLDEHAFLCETLEEVSSNLLGVLS
jgi:hypothetical protein